MVGVGTSIILDRVSATFSRGGLNEVTALNKVSLRVPAGEFVVIVGGNGSGKSTLLNIIAGTVQVDVGSVVFGNDDVTRKPEFARAAKVSFVHQDPLLGTCPALSIIENFALARRGDWWSPLPMTMKVNDQLLPVIERIGLGLEKRLGVPVDSLSGGQRQAIAVAMAFTRQTPIVLLDECLSSLDEATAELTLETIQVLADDTGATVLFVLHDLDRALKMYKRLIVLRGGRIVADYQREDVRSLKRDSLAEQLLHRQDLP